MTRIFENTKYHMPLDVRASHVNNITINDVKAFHQKFIVSNENTYATITVPNEQMAETLLNVFPKGKSPAETTFQWNPKQRVASKTRKYFQDMAHFKSCWAKALTYWPTPTITLHYT